MGKARFSAAFEEGAGGFGPYVVARGRGGPVVRRRAVYKRKSTPEQLAQEARLRAVAARWATFGAAEARAWAAYAAGVEKRDPVTGAAYSPTGYNAFSGLALRVVQIDPSATIPALPPTKRFVGDGVGVSASAVALAVRFSATGANAPGVTTELALQKLANVRRTPTAQYKSMAFVKFVVGSLSVDVPVQPGTYACAVRQVDPATGQCLELVPLGVVTVA